MWHVLCTYLIKVLYLLGLCGVVRRADPMRGRVQC